MVRPSIPSQLRKLTEIELTTELLVPVLLIALYVAFLVALRGVLPEPEELISTLSSLYARFGYEIIFIGAMLEALVLVNFFLPGITALALGAVFARAGQLDLTFAVLVASMGAILGYLVDFILGYYGFGRIIKRMGYLNPNGRIYQQLERNRIRSSILGFIHPNLGSFLALTAGTLKLNFFKFFFLASISTLAWVTIWGILVFALGEIFLTILTKYFILILLLVISIWILGHVRT